MTRRRYGGADDPELLSREATARQLDGLPMFATPVREMARRTDTDTSKVAAIRVADTLSELQQRVYRAFVGHGPMTAKQAEQLPEFADLGFSTVRKRCSEGVQRGWLRKTGRERDGCEEYAAVERR